MSLFLSPQVRFRQDLIKVSKMVTVSGLTTLNCHLSDLFLYLLQPTYFCLRPVFNLELLFRCFASTTNIDTRRDIFREFRYTDECSLFSYYSYVLQCKTPDNYLTFLRACFRICTIRRPLCIDFYLFNNNDQGCSANCNVDIFYFYRQISQVRCKNQLRL